MVELFVALNGQRDMTRSDSLLLAFASSIASQFQDLSSEILENSGAIDTGS